MVLIERRPLLVEMRMDLIERRFRGIEAPAAPIDLWLALVRLRPAVAKRLAPLIESWTALIPVIALFESQRR
jgi:hypothetical protein